MDVDLKIMQELNVNEKNNKFENDAIKITRGAFEYAKLYAKLASKIAGGGMECYGYLLMPKDSLDGVITNIHFADEQLVQSAYVRISDTAVYNASKIMEPKGYQIVGWWHSHGSMNTFHSGTDDDNFRTVLHSVAPRTMYRNKDLLYLIDEKNNEVKFDNFVIKNVDAKKFKESKPTVLKQEEGQPYAYSMVLNMYGEYYLERISKTFNKKEDQYEVDNPIRPRLVVVDKDDDLEFLVSQVEKDIHKKLIFPYNSFDNVCPDWESVSRDRNHRIVKSEDFSDQYSGLVEKFVKNTKDYLINNPDSKHGKTLFSLITGDESKYRYDMLRDGVEGLLDEDQKLRLKNIFDNNSENISDTSSENTTDVNASLVKNIVSTLSDIDARVYLDRSKRLGVNEMRNLLVLQFMLDTNRLLSDYDNNDKAASVNISETIDQMMSKYKTGCLNLADAFIAAEKATKSLSYYAMERITDYKNLKNHKYRNIVSSILDKLNSDDKVFFNKAVYNEIKLPRVNNEKELFLYPDRLRIFNQLFQDIYSLKMDSLHNSMSKDSKPLLSLKKKDIAYNEFLLGFADLYANEKRDERTIDNFIEEKLLSKSGISKKQYKLFQDSSVSIPDYTALDKPKFKAQEGRFNFRRNRYSRYSTYLDDTIEEPDTNVIVLNPTNKKDKTDKDNTGDTKNKKSSHETQLEKEVAEEINSKNDTREKKREKKSRRWKLWFG